MKNLLVAAGACALFAISAADAADMKSSKDNPLLAPWTGPYGGVPPFDQARVDQLAPALEAGMARQLEEIDRIAGDPAAPTFENTLAALERTGRTLDRVSTIYVEPQRRSGRGRRARDGT
jgi:peptidyl-dipeptidase Dcp